MDPNWFRIPPREITWLYPLQVIGTYDKIANALIPDVHGFKTTPQSKSIVELNDYGIKRLQEIILNVVSTTFPNPLQDLPELRETLQKQPDDEEKLEEYFEQIIQVIHENYEEAEKEAREYDAKENKDWDYSPDYDKKVISK